MKLRAKNTYLLTTFYPQGDQSLAPVAPPVHYRVIQGPAIAQGPPIVQGPHVAQGPPIIQGPHVAQGPSTVQGMSVLQGSQVLQGHPVAQAPPALPGPPVVQGPSVLENPPEARMYTADSSGRLRLTSRPAPNTPVFLADDSPQPLHQVSQQLTATDTH